MMLSDTAGIVLRSNDCDDHRINSRNALHGYENAAEARSIKLGVSFPRMI